MPIYPCTVVNTLNIRYSNCYVQGNGYGTRMYVSLADWLGWISRRAGPIRPPSPIYKYHAYMRTTGSGCQQLLLRSIYSVPRSIVEVTTTVILHVVTVRISILRSIEYKRSFHLGLLYHLYEKMVGTRCVRQQYETKGPMVDCVWMACGYGWHSSRYSSRFFETPNFTYCYNVIFWHGVDHATNGKLKLPCVLLCFCPRDMMRVTAENSGRANVGRWHQNGQFCERAPPANVTHNTLRCVKSGGKITFIPVLA